MRVSHSLASGLFFLGFGAFILVAGRGLEMGTTAEMGTGYVPRALAWGCGLVGLFLCGQAWWERRTADQAVVSFALRSLCLVTVMVIAFALLLPRLGLPITVALTIAATAVSGEHFRWLPLTAIAFGMALLTTLLFSTALGVQIPVWPS